MIPKALITLGLVVLIGCGNSGREVPERFTATGTVTIDGKPLEKGTISFASPEDAKLGLAPGIGTIENGEYEVDTRPGKKTVKISAMEEYGEADVTGVKAKRETIAAEFNEKTTLEADVTEEGENKFDFEVKAR